MRPISEVLRLAAQGRSQREISIGTGLAKTTVNRYLRRAEEAGLSWPLPADLDEAALEARLFLAGELRGEPRSGRPEPGWEEAHRELKRRDHHVTLQLLWMEYREGHPDGWGHTQFCVHYRAWLGRQGPVMRLPHLAGEKMCVDFCGDTAAVIDASTGEVWQAQVFVSVLGASGCLYAEAMRGQDSQSWLDEYASWKPAKAGDPAAQPAAAAPHRRRMPSHAPPGTPTNPAAVTTSCSTRQKYGVRGTW